MVRSDQKNPVSLDIYFDYLCPYAYYASLWLQDVKAQISGELIINWKYFSLEQVNSQHGSEWKLWEQPDSYPSRGLKAFWSAEVARSQGEELFTTYHYTLYKARHEERKDISSVDTLTDIAKISGLNISNFHDDLRDRRLLAKLAKDHTTAVETLGIFGTPTLVFPQKQAIFLKLSSVPSPDDSLSLFSELYHLADQRRFVLEIKRP
jgi:predicted DsbA family dithiol-disulfide isomerase